MLSWLRQVQSYHCPAVRAQGKRRSRTEKQAAEEAQAEISLSFAAKEPLDFQTPNLRRVSSNKA
jgi:hypothetical protein